MSREARRLALSPTPTTIRSQEGQSTPHGERIRHELARKGVTQRPLWLENYQEHPDGYRYTRFCQPYRAWLAASVSSCSFEHKAGEKTFVEFAGPIMEIIDPQTGVIVGKVQVFVAAVGTSIYAFAHAVLGQDIASWRSCHTMAFRDLGGISAILVLDHLKASSYDPTSIRRIRNWLSIMAWGASLPAPANQGTRLRPRRWSKTSRDVSWSTCGTWDRRFFSFEEPNAAMAKKLTELNDRVMRGAGSRGENSSTVLRSDTT